MKTFPMLLKRESWEHPALWIVPAVVAGLVVLAMLYGLAKVWGMGEVARHIGVDLSKLATISAEDRRLFLSSALVAGSMPFGFFLAGLVFFYSLDSLYADRRDRSILFWKSMPISDIQTVLSKLVMAIVVAPLFTLAVLAMFHVVIVFLGAMLGLFTGMEGWYLAFNPLAFLQAWGTLLWFLIAGGLVLLPFIGWVMLASAWARKAPFLWAVIPPVAVFTMENIAYDRSYLGQWILNRMIQAPALIADMSARRVLVQLDNGRSFGGDFFAVKFDLLWSGLMWQGVLITAIFITGAIWLRRYRADAE